MSHQICSDAQKGRLGLCHPALPSQAGDPLQAGRQAGRQLGRNCCLLPPDSLDSRFLAKPPSLGRRRGQPVAGSPIPTAQA